MKGTKRPVEPTEFVYKGGKISYSNSSLTLKNVVEIPEFVYDFPVHSITIDNSTGIDLRLFSDVGALEIVNGAESIKFPHSTHTITLRNIAYVPESLKNARNLKRIYIFHSPNMNPTTKDPNRLDINFARLGDINLEYLNIWKSKIKFLPDNVSKLNTIESLQLQNNHISKISPRLYELPRLQRLNLSENKIRELPPGIANLKRLRFLNLRNNYLRTLPPELSDMDRLIEISFQYNPIKTIPPLPFLPNKEPIDFSGTNVDFSIFCEGNPKWLKKYSIIIPDEFIEDFRAFTRIVGDNDLPKIYTRDEWGKIWMQGGK